MKEIVTQRILPIINNGRYENPWNTYKHPSFLSVFKWKLTEKNLSSVPSVDVLNEKLPVMDLKKVLFSLSFFNSYNEQTEEKKTIPSRILY